MRTVKRIFGHPEAGVATMVAALVLGVSLFEPRFLSGETLRIFLLALPILLIVAAGETIVVIARHIDLSVGSIMGFAAIVAGIMFRDYPDTPLIVGFAVAVAVGAGLGLINGLTVSLFKLPSIIVTLGTLSLFRGLLFIVSDSRQIDPSELPEALMQMSQTSPVFGIPWIVLIAITVTAAVWFLLRQTQLGRQIYAIGSNPEASELRGLRVRPVTLIVFTLSGALAGLAGIIYAARFGYVNPGITGVGFEFSVVAAIVIGGVSINGGVGGIVGAALGVILLTAVSVALPILGVSGLWQGAGYGLIILIALLLDRGVRRAALGSGAPPA